MFSIKQTVNFYWITRKLNKYRTPVSLKDFKRILPLVFPQFILLIRPCFVLINDSPLSEPMDFICFFNIVNQILSVLKCVDFMIAVITDLFLRANLQ